MRRWCATRYPSPRSLPSIETYTAPIPAADLTDSELVAEIGIAQALFAVIRVQDPRRITLGYSDAKTRLAVLTAEHRARTNAVQIEQHRIASAARPRIVPPLADLDKARAAVRSRVARAGDVFLGATAATEEEW